MQLRAQTHNALRVSPLASLYDLAALVESREALSLSVKSGGSESEDERDDKTWFRAMEKLLKTSVEGEVLTAE